MNVAVRSDSLNAPENATAPVVIVGGGPVGVRTAQELSRRGWDVVLFNAERWRPYNRVKLTPLLAGEAQVGTVYLDDRFPPPGRVACHDGTSVVDIDREKRHVVTSRGDVVAYHRLVLALGSRAFIPAIPGADLPGVYAFRNFDDAERLVARTMSARHVVVIGGGLLGLEAARGMARRGARVTIVEHENRLMPRQLDEAAGRTLAARIEALGVTVRTGERIASIDGFSRVVSVTLASGASLIADTVVVCTGVRANIQLPAAVGLAFGRAVIVDDEMRTSDPSIYAVGECAEHRGVVYGLVGPGFEHAVTAAASIAGTPVAYKGSVPATKLKVLGADVFSMGDFESAAQAPGVRSVVFTDPQNGIYRRLFLERGKLVAALGVGAWPEASRLQRAVAGRARVSPLALWRLRRTGTLWRATAEGAAALPASAIVCNCTGVTKGAIGSAVARGATTLADVRAATGANTVCGTCQPLVLDLLGAAARPQPVKWWPFVLAFSILATHASLAILLIPNVPVPDTYFDGRMLRTLWFDSIVKQWTGYTLLGITVAAAVLGLRKRIGWFRRFGGYQAWRLVHIALGLLAALVAVAHTGLRLGTNLNLVLMAGFVVMLAAGAVSGFITGGEHKMREAELIGPHARPRALPLWIHILALWPLPALILFHILSVYTW
ncbi:hypothetical protein DLJ53_03795 [Acuticoccus sediminis]|uniref:Nitrite reductase (NADH) large subunit n=1 Tax=Acuticoccus sediminis TaxID=2184697 RepID=A0A8B2NY42_9HYPH|nr:FAD-dependent oxidoreductase [Acuticoccus sediminis]RAI03620.1 hypothetical protein DLJ53_03795 [Acuticoccus sediminis]